MSLRSIVAAGVLLAGVPAGAAPMADPRPNILFVVADDLGWGDVGYHGAKIRTPALDRLASEGVELDRHYVQPLCTPTRTALMSGRCPSRFGPHALMPSNLRAFPPGTPTLASILRAAGYSTALAGKWHLGSREEWGPNHYGFDESYGSLAGAADPWTHQYRAGPYAHTWHRNGKPLAEEGNATELVARQAVEWIRTRPRPWFIYVPFQAVHIPIDTPEEYKRPYAAERFFDDPAKDESYKRFAAFVSQLDAKIAAMVAALDETDQRGRTLVVFHSDNGGLPAGGNAYISKVPPTPALSSNLPLRGHKGQLYEGGIRVVALANWPGRLVPRKVQTPMHAVDWLPTLAGLTGAAIPKDVPLDGIDVWPLLSGTAAASPRTLYIPFRNSAALRHGDWKLIVTAAGKAELYNLARDPYEEKNLAASAPEKAAELAQLLDRQRKNDASTLPADLKDLPK